MTNLTPETRERLARLIYDTQAIQEEHQPWDCLPEWRADYFRRAIDALAAAWPQPAPAGDADVAAIKARLEAATPGPWHVGVRMDDSGDYGTSRIDVVWIGVPEDYPDYVEIDGANAEFIAAAPADVAALLARVAALEAERDTLSAAARAVVADSEPDIEGDKRVHIVGSVSFDALVEALEEIR